MTDPDTPDELAPDEFSMRASDEGPVLEVRGVEIRLRTFFESESLNFDSMNDEYRTEKDCDGDNGCWWTVYNNEKLKPAVTIQPEFLSPEWGGE